MTQLDLLILDQQLKPLGIKLHVCSEFTSQMDALALRVSYQMNFKLNKLQTYNIALSGPKNRTIIFSPEINVVKKKENIFLGTNKKT